MRNVFCVSYIVKKTFCENKNKNKKKQNLKIIIKCIIKQNSTLICQRLDSRQKLTRQNTSVTMFKTDLQISLDTSQSLKPSSFICHDPLGSGNHSAPQLPILCSSKQCLSSYYNSRSWFCQPFSQTRY